MERAGGAGVPAASSTGGWRGFGPKAEGGAGPWTVGCGVGPSTARARGPGSEEEWPAGAAVEGEAGAWPCGMGAVSSPRGCTGSSEVGGPSTEFGVQALVPAPPRGAFPGGPWAPLGPRPAGRGVPNGAHASASPGTDAGHTDAGACPAPKPPGPQAGLCRAHPGAPCLPQPEPPRQPSARAAQRPSQAHRSPCPCGKGVPAPFQRGWLPLLAAPC